MKIVRVAFVIILFFLIFHPKTLAMYDPLSRANNKMGVHILFPSELSDAAKLVNAHGDWGYVTIPIQAGDRNLVKWQSFMDLAKSLHVIPIIRLATEGDYFNTSVWRKPDDVDIIDFANFLNSLNWPVENRYVIVFNEPNRADEWEGNVNPSEYAKLLSYAVTVFKSKSPDFFIISAGLDNAAGNTSMSMNEYTYLRQMEWSVPGIFNQIDGLGSHSYANPAFSQPPNLITSENISSFEYERSLAESFTHRNLPVFITETGWSSNHLSGTTIASYFQQAFASVWSDKDIAAVTPFLLHGNGAQFTDFSFFDATGSPTLSYNALYDLPKVIGAPIVTQSVLGVSIPTPSVIPMESFTATDEKSAMLSPAPFKQLFKWLLKV